MEDFNIPSAERVALLERLQEAIGGAPPYFWAACQICDLESLKKLVSLDPANVGLIAGYAYTMILHWTQSSKAESRSPTPKKTSASGFSSSPAAAAASSSSPVGPSPAKRRKITSLSEGGVQSISRNQYIRDLAEQRDGHCCVLTREAALEVAHIYPFCHLKSPEENLFGVRHQFWRSLRMFWPEEKVAAWEAGLFPSGVSGLGVEVVENLITLSKHAHVYWNRGVFALKPVSLSDDKTTLKVQFFWQSKQDTQETMSLLTTPLSTEDLTTNSGAFDHGEIKLLYSNNQDIKSGDFFELKTDDPTTKPLPSFALLELQWFLTRVVGMAGAAFPYVAGSGDSDSDEEISNLGLDTDAEEDISFLSNPAQPHSPEFLRQHKLLPTVEGSKHHGRGETEGETEELEV